MRYQYLLVDLDDTLLDYHLAEKRSLMETFEEIGQSADEGVCARYSSINRELWDLKEKGLITRPQLRHRRFARLLSELGLPLELADEINQRYSVRLAAHGESIEGARELLSAAHGRVRIAAVTNGVTAVQRARLQNSGLSEFFDAVFTSEDLGIHKPDPKMLLFALRALGCADRREAVMLGDSLKTDIAAANAAGVDSIWYAPRGGVAANATYTVSSLAEARKLLLSGP